MQKELEHAFSLVSRQNNQSIKEGEALLNKLKSNIDYPILLLSYLKDSITYEGKLRAAIELRIWSDNYKVLIYIVRIWNNFSEPLIQISFRI